MDVYTYKEQVERNENYLKEIMPRIFKKEYNLILSVKLESYNGGEKPDTIIVSIKEKEIENIS